MKRADEAIVEEDGAEEPIINKMVADVAEQVGGAMESVADQVDAKNAADQGPIADILE